MRSGLVLLFVLVHDVRLLVGQEEASDAYEEPEEEPSALEDYHATTHGEAGQQFDFVGKEAVASTQKRPQGESDMPSVVEQLQRLLNGGGESKMLKVEPLSLTDMLKAVSEATLSQAAKAPRSKGGAGQKRPTASLPSIKPGTPISQVLQHMRRSLETAASVEAARQPPPTTMAKRSGARMSSDRDRMSGTDDYIGRLDARGLDMLEAELRAKLARIALARRRMASGDASHDDVNVAAAAEEEEERPEEGMDGMEEEEEEDRAGEEEEEEEEEDSVASGVVGTALGGSGAAHARMQSALSALEGALGRMLGDLGEGSESDNRGEGDGSDDTASYAARLAAEARARDGLGADDGTGHAEGGLQPMRVAEGTPLHEMLKEVMGGHAEGGEPVQIQVPCSRCCMLGPPCRRVLEAHAPLSWPPFSHSMRQRPSSHSPCLARAGIHGRPQRPAA